MAKQKPFKFEEWNEAEVAISDIIPNPNNPRTITKEQFAKLRASIEKVGYHARMVCDGDLNLLSGHMRLLCLKEMGIESVRILVPPRDLTEEEKAQISIQDNLHVGAWDMDALSSSFESETLLEWGFPAKLLDVMGDAQPEDDDGKEISFIANLSAKKCRTCGQSIKAKKKTKA